MAGIDPSAVLPDQPGMREERQKAAVGPTGRTRDEPTLPSEIENASIRTDATSFGFSSVHSNEVVFIAFIVSYLPGLTLESEKAKLLMVKRFESAAIKINRARKHLADLRSEISSFFGRGGVYVALEIPGEFNREPSFETAAFIYHENEPIPVEWSATIGDVIHNLRSALDLIACHVHRITKGNPKDIGGVQYPFCSSKAELSENIRKRRLGHIGRDFLSVIEETAPYPGGNDGLRAIHDLDIMDKHRTLVPTVSIVSIDWPVKIQTGSQQFQSGVTKDGQRLIIFPRIFSPLPIGSRIKANFSIIFGVESVFQGRDVAQQLEACLGAVEFILSRFRAAAEKA